MFNYFRATVAFTLIAFGYFLINDPEVVNRMRRQALAPNYCTKAGLVSLTFDEGPSPLTPSVLQALAQVNISVTFHVVTKYLDNVASVTNIQTAYRNGHLIGLRFPTTMDPSAMSESAFQATLLTESNKLFTVIQAYPKYLRLPAGQYNANHVKIANTLGMIVTEWNVDTNDYNLDPATGLSQMIGAYSEQFSQVGPGLGRYVSLHHDLSQFYSNATNVVETVKYIKNYQYNIVRLDMCLSADAYRKSNGVNGGGSGSPPPTSGGNGVQGPNSVTSSAQRHLLAAWASMSLVALLALMF
ncbi:hypothetical protein MIR68_010785 [Amoeboaphelidium protococcarum]|nr:hypothetical protein MIR68_010785 [Amoeboaphelidium protococcarum]